MKATIIILTIIGLTLSSCNQLSDEAKAYQDNFEIVGDEKEQVSEISKTVFDNVDRQNQQAEPSGSNISDGHDELKVPEGRYEISGHEAGNVYVYDQNDHLVLHEIIGLDVNFINVSLTEDHVIRVDGFSYVEIQPVETNIDNPNLTAGIWKVGVDIEPGTYQATAYEGMGYLIVYDSQEKSKVYEVIGGENAEAFPTVELKEGQTIKITEIPLITFKQH
ncbi:hypothetical protein ACTWQB_05720 [Piscibacillus sp. B03]|uniref:hypothetical protein n=1 Tax=Piscibacillus sp. B03 TaxID=3457430 RepID=UPI003FCDFE80